MTAGSVSLETIARIPIWPPLDCDGIIESRLAVDRFDGPALGGHP